MSYKYKKRLERSRSGIFLGVCRGIADWRGWDPAVVRLVTVLLAVFTSGFPLFVAYIVLGFVIPLESQDMNFEEESRRSYGDDNRYSERSRQERDWEKRFFE